MTLTPEVTKEPSPTETMKVTEEPNPTLTEITTPTFSCLDAPPSRVQVGDMARITFTDGTSTWLRSEPQVGDNVVEKLAEGTEFEIISGPECTPRSGNDGSYVYWEVNIPSKSLTGWVAEGDLENYYIEPLPNEITDDFGVEMVLVPEGEFIMGSEKYEDEMPIHRVFLSTSDEEA